MHVLPRHNRAFTLLEMSVAIVVVAVIAVTVVPAWSSLTSTRQAAAAEEVERRLVAARSQAVSEGRPVGVYVDPATDSTLNYTISASGGTPSVMTNFDGQADSAFLVAATYPGAEITSVVGGSGVGGAQILWFGFDGSPELRTSTGTLTGPWTQDAVITFAGGYQVTVRRRTGTVSR